MGNTSPNARDGGPSVRVVHRTDRFVVVDKPCGLRAVPGLGPDGEDCVPSRLALAHPDLPPALIVHRLDMATSGLMVLALDAHAHALLSLAFERRRVAKRYEALLAGEVGGEGGEIELPLRPDYEDRPRQIVDHEQGRPARTRWRRIGVEVVAGRAVTRVEMEPLTGRTHQLRLHAGFGLGAPIVGDTLYGGGEAEAPRLMLHARSLTLPDPETMRRVTFESAAPF